ncbi:17736_t:CDS:2 [Dentiscutata erythropus]|uniref:17736_t:CDS:1 n=1 Tax=Dentiscutata erythropus TaxID=1348616 RepID=A0A9N8VTS5_9GLOM|nr:17736_t:CDS:2 [Dentiscutata erythropus]
MTFVMKFLRILHPTSLFSSLSDLRLLASRKLVKSLLKKEGLPDIATSASMFLKDDINALGVKFRTVVNFPEEYILPQINRKILKLENLDIDKFGIVNGQIRTFIRKMNWVVVNEAVEGTRESNTDTLVDNLLRVVEFDVDPLAIRSYISAEPEFVVSKRGMALVIEGDDKHLKNVRNLTNYGETQLAAKIIACGNENVMDKVTDQIIFAMRVISMHVTFYKATIPKEYWANLHKGLPKKHSVEIMRWPAENGERTGLDLANPEGRKRVLRSLVKIRQFALGHDF